MAAGAPASTARPSDEERWEQALSIARGTPTRPALDKQRRRRRNVLLGVVGLLVAATLAGFVTGLLFPDAFGGRTQAAGGIDQRETVKIVMVFAGLAVEAVGVVMLVRARQWGARWRSAVSVLRLRQRRLVLRQVRGRVPADPDHLPIALDLARRLVATDGLLVMYAGLTIMQLGRLIDQSGPFSELWTAGVVVLFLVAGILVLRDRRLAARFLDQHAREAP